ncbi:hypothetical protein H6G17_29745 [Chroococcidiopsis sp. FACHB-1243]|uniref:hypothetical protein n=1 Tax=Chroococcidiopsis sp. [FACHB-1243] TaxID=2692781 RepID=UPI001780F621|nr:hypothetical protein [Chroococcidiopsis sp. [FACHB-1243]]MBD2309612.1 hypothetical protein [Chroococcidiopsis sp. [FACHB-1243]]
MIYATANANGELSITGSYADTDGEFFTVTTAPSSIVEQPPARPSHTLDCTLGFAHSSESVSWSSCTIICPH